MLYFELSLNPQEAIDAGARKRPQVLNRFIKPNGKQTCLGNKHDFSANEVVCITLQENDHITIGIEARRCEHWTHSRDDRLRTSSSSLIFIHCGITLL